MLITAAALFALMVGGLSLTSQRAWADGYFDQDEAFKVLAMVNAERASKGLPALVWDNALEESAKVRAKELVERFEHFRPDGSLPWTAFREGYRARGENILHAEYLISAQDSNQMWTDSPDHYVNMVSTRFTCMATAMYVQNGNAYWVELFGDPALSPRFVEQPPADTDNNNQQTQNPPANTPKLKEEWVKVQGGWKYRLSSGSYAANTIRTIGGKRYYFDGQGWMKTGWLRANNYWYYFDKSGPMKTGWHKSGSKWYFLENRPNKSVGTMVTGKQVINGATYIMNNDGAMYTGWAPCGNEWYYCSGSGAIKTGWVKSGGKWYFLENRAGKTPGVMLSDTKQMIDKTVYFFGESGAMATGWTQYDGFWYYCTSSGAMKRSAWVGNYWVSVNGVMSTDAWVDNGRYYVDGSGRWVPGARR